MNQSIKMCFASAFVVSGGIIAMGIIEQLNTPLSKSTCFNGYTDCGNELRHHHYELVPYMLGGLIAIGMMCVILYYNKVFNKMEIDR